MSIECRNWFPISVDWREAKIQIRKWKILQKNLRTTHRILFEPTGGRRVGGWPAEISCAQFSAQASEFVWKLIKIFTLLHPVMVSKNCRFSCNVGWTLFLPYHVTPRKRLRSIINCFFFAQGHDHGTATLEGHNQNLCITIDKFIPSLRQSTKTFLNNTC